MAENQKQSEEVVVQRATWEWSEMWKKEDWWAIWLGAIILIVGLIIFMPRPPADMDAKISKAEETMAKEKAKAPFDTIEWHGANDALSGLRARDGAHGKFLAKWLASPVRWANKPIDSLYLGDKDAAQGRTAAEPKYKAAQEKTKEALNKAKAVQAEAAAADFKNVELNKKAEDAIDAWRKARHTERGSVRAAATTQPYNRIPTLIVLMIVFTLFFSIGTKPMGVKTGQFMKGFWFVFLIAVIAGIVGQQATLAKYGFGDILWAIILGMLISNTIGTPKFAKPALMTEYFIKTGLVLLGAEILFSKILAIGTPGIFVAWLVTPTVLILTYWFGQRVVGMESRTLNITVSADMSVCGVSAAIATAAACRAKKEELTIAIGMSMLFTAIMMIALPAFIVAVGMNPVLGGAWIGGTVDSTGAVVAAGAMLGDVGMFVAATVKMIQNILIGVIAFGVAVYWCTKVDCIPGERVSKMEIWYRFPKFVLGFIAASIVFSWMLTSMGAAGDVMIDQGVLRGFSRMLREWMFLLAFASIGLSSNFREMAKYFKGGKPVILYVCGQSFNLILTLTMAYIMFMLVFPGITANLLK